VELLEGCTVCAYATPRSIRVERKLGRPLRATVDVAMIRERRAKKTKGSKQLGYSDSVALTYPDEGGRRVRWTEDRMDTADVD
jgi:hypothetical protein